MDRKKTLGGDKSVRLINGCNYTKISDLRPNIESRKHCNAVFVKGEVFLFGGRNSHDNFVQTVEKYSVKSNRWQSIAELNENNSGFSVCSFMDKVYLIGGEGKFVIYNEKKSTNNIDDSDESFGSESDDFDIVKKFFNSCLEFDTKSYKLKKVSCINFMRSFGSSSVVFEEKVVIAGGRDDDYSITNTVESYDVFADKWALMPSLTKNFSGVLLVTVKNKLLAFKNHGVNPCEVFDKISNKFMTLIIPMEIYPVFDVHSTIGNKIFVFPGNGVRKDGIRSIAYYYDVDENDWSELTFEIPKRLKKFNCLKVPSVELFNFE